MTASPTSRHGSCLCGKVQVHMIGDPERKVLCHCVSCQKASGVVFEANVFYRTRNVEIVDPESLIRTYLDSSCDSGNTVERSFCGNCGSHIHTLNPKSPWVADLIIVPIGIIDGDKSDLQPLAEYYIKRRVDWIPSIGGAEQCREMT